MDLSNHSSFKTVVEQAGSARRIRMSTAGAQTTNMLQLALEGAGAGIWELDLSTRMLSLCSQSVRMHGLPDDHPGTMTYREWLDLIHADDVAMLTGRFPVAHGHMPHAREFRIHRSDGEIRWLRILGRMVPDEAGKPARLIGLQFDDTDRRRAEEAARESEALKNSIIEASADCVKLLDLDGRLLFMNRHGIAALEVQDPTTIFEKNWADLWPPQERAKVEGALQAARTGTPGRFNGGCPTATGSPRWWDVVVTPILDEQGRPRQLLAISRDVTEHRNNLERVRWTASHDALTELPNRRYFQDRLTKVLARAGALGWQVGLLHLDVDDFKQVNDALGHDAGDALLKTFTERLLSVVHHNDTVARLGGDEFAIIIPRLTANRTIAQTVDAILARLKEPFIYQGCVFDCRASIGAALYPKHGLTADDLLKSADIALYAAKTAGCGGVQLFQPAMRSEMQARLAMITRARTALNDDNILPFYQPKICFRSGSMAGFEALLRWRHPHDGIQLPATIAAAFEDLEIAQAISERMQVRVLADMRRWLDKGVEFGHVGINASAAEFRQNNFAERLLDRVKAAGVPTHHLELEVTETVFLGRGAEYVDRALHLLSAEGIRIALDDFGTGYASLSHLKQFPVDIIKIDQSFVRNLEDDEDDVAIVRALVSLGRSLSIGIVAEGVETEAQAAFLADQGCDYGQGYLFSKAIAASNVPDFLSNFSDDRWRRVAPGTAQGAPSTRMQ